MVAAPDTAGLREVSRELGLDATTVQYWVEKGWVRVIQPAAGPGKPMLLDRQSVLTCWKLRRKKDSRHKNRALKTIAQTPHPTRADPAPHPRRPREGYHTQPAPKLTYVDGRWWVSFPVTWDQLYLFSQSAGEMAQRRSYGEVQEQMGRVGPGGANQRR